MCRKFLSISYCGKFLISLNMLLFFGWFYWIGFLLLIDYIHGVWQLIWIVSCAWMILNPEIICLHCVNFPWMYGLLFWYFMILVLHDIHRSIGDWQSKFNWNLTSLKGKSLKAVIMRLVWRGFLYFIWKERTTVLLHRSLKNPQHVFDKLVVAVKIRLFKLNFPCNQANSKLLENWW